MLCDVHHDLVVSFVPHLDALDDVVFCLASVEHTLVAADIVLDKPTVAVVRQLLELIFFREVLD